MSAKAVVIVHGAFDDLRSGQLRLLQAASELGDVTVLLWSDDLVRRETGKEPRLPLPERFYFLSALRSVSQVVTQSGLGDPNVLPARTDSRPRVWVDEPSAANIQREAWCREHGVEYLIMPAARLRGFPVPPLAPGAAGRKKVVVTGCYDWFHSGHVRFFEEVSTYGDLYVIIGHDANIRLLKGEGHPLIAQEERRYVVGSVRFVKEALISSGQGWLDADPEIQRLKPDIYAVNEDGDKGGKREYCERLGIEYLVLHRTPAPGLPRRSSTVLRGF